MTHITQQVNGDMVYHNPVTWQGLHAVGETTGVEYLQVGANVASQDTSSNFYANQGATTETVATNVQLIAAGSGVTLVFHETIHITVDATGQVTAVFDHLTMGCV